MSVRSFGVKLKPIQLIGKAVLSTVLTPYGKRIFFLTSLYMQMRHQHISLIQQNTLQKLNQTLRLARSESALMLAAHAHKVVWPGDLLTRIVEQDKELPIDVRCDAIIDLAPEWLKYGSKDDMSKDIGLLLKEV